MMPTSYLWKQRLLSNSMRNSDAIAAAQDFARNGRMDALLCELRCCGNDVQRMIDVALRCLDDFPAEHRQAVALVLYRSTQGQGDITYATEAALGFVS